MKKHKVDFTDTSTPDCLDIIYNHEWHVSERGKENNGAIQVRYHCFLNCDVNVCIDFHLAGAHMTVDAGNITYFYEAKQDGTIKFINSWERVKGE